MYKNTLLIFFWLDFQNGSGAAVDVRPVVVEQEDGVDGIV
jgi:hypothetical protein